MSRLPPFVRELAPLIAVAAPAVWWVVSTNSAQDVRLTAVESNVRNIVTTLDGIEKRGGEGLADLKTGVRRLDDKLSTLLMQGYRPAAEPARR